MAAVVIFLIAAGGFWILFRSKKRSAWKEAKTSFPASYRNILMERVGFYNTLSAEEKKRFETEIQEFLLNHRVTGIDVKIDDVDRVLVAASAIIPIFQFPDWRYSNLFEVLIYPGTFNEKFETSGKERAILGMVGTGYMNGKMILSQKALRLGFSNDTDKRNTAIHEFVHLIDKEDGTIDGIPEALISREFALPWLKLIEQKMDEIHADDSDINPYGATDKSEFLPVVSEYFFERPKLLATKHPELYKALEKMFKHDMEVRPLNQKRQEIRRNSACPCDSGLKFKHCCGSDD